MRQGMRTSALCAAFALAAMPAFAQASARESTDGSAQQTMENLALQPLGSGGVGQIAPEPRDVDAFVAANLEWLVTHALATLLTETFGYDAPDADAADSFASSRVSARHDDEEAARRLAFVAEAFSLASVGDAPSYFVTNDLDRARAFRVLCVANGADNAIARDAMGFADAPPDGFDGCAVDRDLATEEWDVALSADFAFPDDPPGDVAVRYAEPDEGDANARAAIERSGVLEALADEVATTYSLFDPLTLEARSCDGGAGELVVERATLTVCYGLVDALRALARPSPTNAVE